MVQSRRVLGIYQSEEVVYIMCAYQIHIPYLMILLRGNWSTNTAQIVQKLAQLMQICIQHVIIATAVTESVK